MHKLENEFVFKQIKVKGGLFRGIYLLDQFLWIIKLQIFLLYYIFFLIIANIVRFSLFLKIWVVKIKI